MEQQALIDKAAIKLCPISIKLIQQEYPVESSRGGVNTIYHHCDIYQGRPSYASCLTVMDQAFEGKNEELRPECHKAVANKTCPALAMRKAELAAGRALFFVDYRDVVKERKRVQDEAETEILFGRRSKETTAPRGKFVPTVFDAKGNPIFDKEKAAEVELHMQVGPDNSKFKPQKSKPKIERVGNGEVGIMQKVLEKVIQNDNSK